MADEICFEAPEINMASEWVNRLNTNYNICLYNKIKLFLSEERWNPEFQVSRSRIPGARSKKTKKGCLGPLYPRGLAFSVNFIIFNQGVWDFQDLGLK